MIGKPSVGKLHAGFGEGGLDDCLCAALNGHEGESRIQARVGLKAVEPVFYSTVHRKLLES